MKHLFDIIFYEENTRKRLERGIENKLLTCIYQESWSNWTNFGQWNIKMLYAINLSNLEDNRLLIDIDLKVLWNQSKDSK